MLLLGILWENSFSVEDPSSVSGSTSGFSQSELGLLLSRVAVWFTLLQGDHLGENWPVVVGLVFTQVAAALLTERRAMVILF